MDPAKQALLPPPTNSQYGHTNETEQQQPISTTGLLETNNELPYAVAVPVANGAPVPIRITTIIDSRRPVRVICPNCHADVQTRTIRQVGGVTHLTALGLCFIGCWPCAWVPYCSDECLDTSHVCPHCDEIIGFKRGC
jgi:lipopolysaccharide-induced tumor necrosis factor-alpha factor